MSEAISLNLPFFVAGIIIFIGFFGTLFFQKTRLPDLLFLIAVGVLIGPAFKWISPGDLKGVTPYFGRIALIIILFEGGLHLDFGLLIKYIKGSIGLGLGVFAVTVASTWALGEYYLGMERIPSLILGCILGGTSSAVIIPLINKMNVNDETRAIISLESVLTDIFVVLGVIILIQISGQTTELQASAILNKIGGSFTIALFAGLIVGLLWTKALGNVKLTSLSYMTTLATVLVLYGTVEMFEASGAVAAFTFGLVLRNGTRFLRVLDENKVFTLDPKIEQFHGEFTFFIRTYFFVYLGLLFTSNMIRPDILITAAILCVVLISARYLYILAYSILYKPIRKARFTYFVMLPRGLATAVVASMPFAAGVKGTENFESYSTLIILFTTVFMVMGIFLTERSEAKNNGGAEGGEPEEVVADTSAEVNGSQS